MAVREDKALALESGKSILGTGNQKQVDRMLKKAADQAAKAAQRRWKSAGRNPFAKHAKAGASAFEKAFGEALKGALNYHSNHAGPRPSIKMRAPDTGGRPFHFDHTAVSSQTINLKPGETTKAGSTYGKRQHAREKRHASRSAAHMHYLEREGAAESIEADLEASAGIRAEMVNLGRELTPGGMQEYLEDPSKEEKAKAGREPPSELVFSYGTIGETLEERTAFWDLAEEHARGERGTIQHRLIMELPHEASPQDRLAIMKAFTAKFDEDEVPYHVVLHAPTSKNDSRNYHAHVVLLGRPATNDLMWPEGGAHYKEPERPLVRTWDFAARSYGPDANKHVRWSYPKRQKIPEDYRATFVKDQRKRFSDIVNERMVSVGNEVRYDHRSYRAMGLETEAMKSITRIVKDKARKGDRLVFQFAQTKREVEAEIDRLARERRPEFAEISKVRAAVRNGERALRALEREAGFMRKPVLKRGVHAVSTFVRKRALDYARTRALHLEREIEATQQIRSIERVAEATNPATIAKVRKRLTQTLIEAKTIGNDKETKRLEAELETIPKVAYAAILHRIATEEVATLKAKHERHALVRLGKVREALSKWRSAAAGERPDLASAAAPSAMASIAETVALPVRQLATTVQLARAGEHPMWRAYDSVVDQVFPDPVSRMIWEQHKRFGQFIIDNADPNVPGLTPMDLANKLIEAVKQHPAKAEELIMSYREGHVIGGDVPEPVFRGAPAAMPRPRPGQLARASSIETKSVAEGPTPRREDHSRQRDLNVTAEKVMAEDANRTPAASRVAPVPDSAQMVPPVSDVEPEAKPKRKQRKRDRRRAILVKRDGWER